MAASNDAGEIDAEAGGLGASETFGGKLRVGGVGVGSWVVDGVGCPNLNPSAGAGCWPDVADAVTWVRTRVYLSEI